MTEQAKDVSDAMGGDDEAKALLTAERDAARKDLAAAGEALAQAEKDRDDAIDGFKSLDRDFAEVSKQRDALAAENARLKKQPRVAPAPKPKARRKAGPVDGLVDSDRVFRLVKGGTFEIVFSDGTEEIDALPPVLARPDAWLRTGAGTMLREPVTVTPNAQVELAGFGLFDAEGEQIAWCPMAQPVIIKPGMAVKLDRQILF